MKSFYTSYYGNAAVLARNGLAPNCVSISASAPKFFTGLKYLPLAPTWQLLSDYKSHKIDQQQYTDAYVELLIQRGITAEKIQKDLPDGAILMCYEKPGDFCHRRVFAQWMLDTYSISIPEFVEHKPSPVDNFFTL